MIYGRDAFLHSKSHLCGVALTFLCMSNAFVALLTLFIPKRKSGQVVFPSQPFDVFEDF